MTSPGAGYDGCESSKYARPWGDADLPEPPACGRGGARRSLYWGGSSITSSSCKPLRLRSRSPLQPYFAHDTNLGANLVESAR